MSIVNMQRIAVIGLDTDKEKLMSQLMDFGAVEITSQTEKLADEAWSGAAVSDENQEEVTRLEGKIAKTDIALGVIETYYTGKKPLFKTRREIKKSGFEQLCRETDKAQEDVDLILSLNDGLHEITEKINKLDSDRLSLTPWENYDLPLEVEETDTAAIFMGVLPLTTDPGELEKELEETVGTVVFKRVHSDKDMHYVAGLCPKELQEQVLTDLKQKGFAAAAFKDFQGTAADNLKKLQDERQVLEKEFKEAEADIAGHSNLKDPIEEYHDILTIKADREKVRAKLLKTKRTFFIEGWIPTKCAERAAAILDENRCYYAFRDPKEGEEVPVILKNSSFFTPFESITEMYSLPDYKGFDPTSIYAIFYAVFFGMMLSDAGYGIIMTIACFAVLKKYRLEGMTYKMIKLFFYCGISTTFWGAMFGGWFGDFFQVFARTILGKEITIAPLWFNPIEDPMKLLIFSLILGVIHIFIGMGIKAYMLIKDSKWFDALCDIGFWYFLLIGLGAWLVGGMMAPAMVTVGQVLAAIGALGLLLTGGRNNKGFGKITGGLGAIYNITSYLSDILSYARLLALGLATGVIAQVVNTMGAMGGGGVKGTIILLVAFVGGHLFNLAINALGAFIHSSRLQYIEFFGKFYEDGGEPFDPFRKNTKYIKISQDE